MERATGMPLVVSIEHSANMNYHSTLKPACFSDYTTGDEAVAFFQTAVRVFQVRNDNTSSTLR